MMKKLLPLLFTLFTSSVAFAQPLNAKGYYKAGVNFKNKSMFLEAIASFRKAIALDKKMDSAYIELGTLYVTTTRPDSALWCFNKAVAINPGNTGALILLGNFYRDVKPNYDSAITCYNLALKKDSLNKVTYYSLAWCYNAKGQNEKAIPYGIKALEIDNNYRPAYNELGHAYRRTEKYTEAIEQFKKNLSISVVDLALLYTGFCYIQLKNRENALQQYEALKKINEKMAAALKKQIDAMQ